MTVEITKDIVADVLKRVRQLTKSELLVGIPEKNAARKDEDDEGPINNAALGYVHEFGSPAKNIPPRPFLIPGVNNARPAIVKQLKIAGENALTDGVSGVKKQMRKAGEAAVTAVQAKFHDGSMVPIKEETKKARLRKKQAYKNASEKRRAKMMAAYLEGDFTPLVASEQLLRSIVFVLHQKGSKK